MALPKEPIVKKFFTNKIESTRDDWYGYLVQIARIFYTLDGEEYSRDVLMDKFAAMSGRDASLAQRDSSNFRDEFGAYGTYLGIYHLEQRNGKWCIFVSDAAKKFLCCENPNAAAFCRAQLSLFQYPNGAGSGISANGGQSVQGNIKADTLREIQNGIRLNPLRLICKIVVGEVEINNKKFSDIAIPYTAIFCMVNDSRINQDYNPSVELVTSVFSEYSAAGDNVEMSLDGLTNFKRNFHILEKTGLFTRDSKFGLLIAQRNYAAAYDCIKVIADMDMFFSGFEELYDSPDENGVRDVISSPKWGQYYDAARLSSDILAALGVEEEDAPIKSFLSTDDFSPAHSSQEPDSQEGEFKKWLAAHSKTNGIAYSENTRNQYISALKAVSGSFAGAITPYTSIFEITQVATFDRALSAIKANERYEAFNKARGNGSLSAGLVLYRRFLVEKASGEDVEYLSPAWFRLAAEKYVQVDTESNALYQQFQSLYAPEKLRTLSDDDLLGYIFLGVNDRSLCNALEFDAQYTQFGSIAGGTAYKYNLFYSRNEETWKTSFGEGGQRSVSQEEALEIGKQIRDALVAGADVIANHETLATVNDYNDLLNELNAVIPQYITKMWFLKYYHMMFPHILPNFYNEAWQKHILCNLNIVPSDAQFIRMGQINAFVNECGISNIVFSKIIFDSIGSPKTFYRIGTGDNGIYFGEWRQNNYIAIGWNELGDLTAAYQEDADSKAIITDALKSQWNYDNRLASRKYGEINSFYSAAADTTYAVAMAGQKILAIGLVTGGYFFDEEKEYGHCRPVRWLKVFEEGKTLPFEGEGKLTTFYELKNSENICYLYSLLHGRDETAVSVTEENVVAQIRPISFATGLSSDQPRNRILFGAPGTGKSFTLNREKNALLGDGGEYERVTFHPDYSYANFVGTYKPVPCKDSDGKDAITYSYVPGPFMRTYVKALQNSRTDEPKPFLLVIEEINRANVAAVFGDVFQLLDRGDDEVSEYPIQASEDIKKYLAGELGGNPDDYSEIRIPDNMFIWATMNSADQGVFPMDTAFKRRWDFTYLGIDDSEAGIVGKKVILGQGDYRRIVEWNALRKAINNELLTYKVNEDKLLGPYFISKKNLPEGEMIDPAVFTRIFKNKVIMYLFDDAAKQKRISLFGGCDEKAKNQYSKICREFDTKGVYIFCEAISSQFIDNVPEDDGE